MTDKNNFDTEFKKGMEIPCPQCRENMNMTAKRCPNCQYDFSDDEVRANIASKKTNPLGCAVIVGIIAVVAVIGLAFSSGGDEASDIPNKAASKTLSSGEVFAYKEAAKTLISAKLRDPDSAIFSNMVVYPEREDRSVIICGYVNSRNGFGGMTGAQRFITGGTVMLEEEFTKEQMSIAWTRFCN